jgi:hypothetical protein
LVRIDGTKDILLTSVDSDNTSGNFKVRDINFDGEAKIPSITDEFEFGVAPNSLRQLGGTVLDRLLPDGKTFLVEIEIPIPNDRDDEAFVLGEAPFLVGLHGPIRSDNMPEEGAGDLGREFEIFTDRAIELSGEGRSGLNTMAVKNDSREPVGCVLISDSNREKVVRAGVDLEFEGSLAFHSNLSYIGLNEIPLLWEKIFGEKKEDAGNSSHRLKTGGFPCQNSR